MFQATQAKTQRSVAPSLPAIGARQRYEGERRRIAGNFIAPALQICRCGTFHCFTVAIS
jgi:hypothetical protein